MINYSFIIPHHNTPDLLARLLKSIPYRADIEIIVVDDNSDNGKKPNIRQDNVRVIYLGRSDSKGAGHARNVGLSTAIGKWLLFADSDDFYIDGFLDTLDTYIDDESDIVFFDIISVDSLTLEKDKKNRAHRNNMLINNFDGSKSRKDELLFLSWSPWNKMVKYSFVKEYGFQYEEVPNGNDVFFSFQLGYFAKSIKVIKKPLYALTFFSESITYKRKFFLNRYTTYINMRKRENFFEFIGHPEWNIKSLISSKKVNYTRWIIGIVMKQPFVGLRLMLYVLTHLRSITKESFYYVEEIKKISKSKIPV